ncbi:MAG: zinc ABC transporter substrate-binding protein [Sneathiella sp.]
MLAIGLIFVLSVRAYAVPASEVVATIAPLHSLVQGVMGDTGEARLLVTGNASPHDFQLKPSQMALLHQARFVFYIGGNLEAFLTRTLESLPGNVRKVAMTDQQGITVFEVREGGEWEHHDHSAHDHQKEDVHHHHEHGEPVDPHIWLDPVNAVAMVKAITRELSDAFPEKRSIYKTNALSMISKIEESDEKVKSMLTPVKDTPFIVFHDAYQYFEKRYGLTAVGSIVLDPGEAASVQRIAVLRQKVQDAGAVCIFREPQFSDKLSLVVAEGTPVKLGVIDPVGGNLKPGSSLYPQLLRGVAEGLVSCLE